MHNFAHLVRRFFGRRDGLAAVEFAFIAPIMVVLFFGVVEGSAALSANRKVILSANTLSDLVAQETSVTTDALDDLFVGMEDIIDSRDIDATFTVISVYYDTTFNLARVHWSYDSTGATPYAAGSLYHGDLDTSILDDTSSVIIGEADYNYVSSITQKVIGPLTLSKMSARWPRRSNKVQLCNSVGVCTH
ncbi:MAG: TadE/TadG family type IV pilus assembly protein [Parvularculaceae bacterium]